MKIIKQGKYECVPACMVQLLGMSIFEMKYLLGYYGWRNDSSGTTSEQMRDALNFLDMDIVNIGGNTVKKLGKFLPPSILTIKSLNYPKMHHALSWVPKYNKVIDPNVGYPGRKYIHPVPRSKLPVPIVGAAIIVNRVLTKQEHKEIEFMRRSSIGNFVEYLHELGVL